MMTKSIEMRVTIFYSWQSDVRAAATRTLIQDALESAVKDLRHDDSIAVEPVVDRDTLAVPGAPDIGKAILEKIESCAAMVAEVTIVNSDDKLRPTPNPNVLIELGYALKSLGERRIILVQNTAFGGPELLPFDLRQKRTLTYNSPKEADSRADERRKLHAGLREALTLIIADLDLQPTYTAEYPVEIAIGYTKKSILSERHDYELRVTLKNLGTKPIKEWHVDVEMPTGLLTGSVHVLRLPERSDRNHTLFRSTQDTHRGPIYPGDSRVVSAVDYYVDNEIYFNEKIMSEKVVAIAYMHGEGPAKSEKFVRDLQNF